MGHPVPLNQKTPDYLAASLGNFILGGDFSTRLMHRVREETGLTYHIQSNFGGLVGEDVEGHWVVNLTAKADSLDQAIQETRKQISAYVEDGASEKEVAGKKGTIAGRFRVNLATTEGLATSILRNEQLKFGIHYIDEFPKLINDLKVKDVNQAIKKYIQPDALSVVIAGERKS